MAFELTSSETARLETSIATALQAFRGGSVSEAEMVLLVRRLVDAAALDNHEAVTDWLFPESVRQWIRDCEGNERTKK